MYCCFDWQSIILFAKQFYVVRALCLMPYADHGENMRETEPWVLYLTALLRKFSFALRQRFGVKFYPSFPRGLENSRSDKVIVNSCQVLSPHYSARPKRFESRCPSDREGLGKRRTGTTQSQ